MNRWCPVEFRAAGLFRMALSWWIHVSKCLSKLEPYNKRVHPKANDGLEVTMTDHFGSAM